MASLLLVLLASAPPSCRLTGPFRSWLTDAERLRGPPPAAAKDTEARGRPRLMSIRERLEKEGWRLTEKLLTDMLEVMMVVWRRHNRRRREGRGGRAGRCNNGLRQESALVEVATSGLLTGRDLQV